jgi:hypothetical protein
MRFDRLTIDCLVFDLITIFDPDRESRRFLAQAAGLVLSPLADPALQSPVLNAPEHTFPDTRSPKGTAFHGGRPRRSCRPISPPSQPRTGSDDPAAGNRACRTAAFSPASRSLGSRLAALRARYTLRGVAANPAPAITRPALAVFQPLDASPKAASSPGQATDGERAGR